MDNADQTLLERHLLTRGLFEPADMTEIVAEKFGESISGSPIMDDEAQLEKVASAWENNREAIEAVIKVRIQAICMGMILTDVPQEILVSRQALLELAGVLRDFEKYFNSGTNLKANRPRVGGIQVEDGAAEGSPHGRDNGEVQPADTEAVISEQTSSL